VTALDSVPRLRVALVVLVVLAVGTAALLAPLPTQLLVGTTLVLLGVVTLLLRPLGVRWRDLGFARPDRPRRAVLLGVGTALGLLVVSQVVMPVIQRVTGVPPDLEAFAVLRGNLGALIGGLAVVWTLAAFGEELIARAFLMQATTRILPDQFRASARWGIALVASSVVFGLAHAYQGPTGMLGAGVLGAGFGLAYLAGGRNLWPAILAHGIYDTVGFVAVFSGMTPGG
jgi:membrane protease YdiL (CAAX protease family)